MTFLLILLVGAIVGTGWVVIEASDYFQNRVPREQRQQNKRQDQGQKILEDLITWNDLGDATVHLPDPLLKRVDDWLNKRDDGRKNGWNRRYRQLAAILHDVNHPSDVDEVAVVPPRLQSRIEDWLTAHRRAIGGN